MHSKSKYWRNNLVELGPSLSGFLDKFASFLRLVCQTNVLNPEIKPSTFRDTVGDAYHYTIQAITA
jgi:hypothetical protein